MQIRGKKFNNGSGRLKRYRNSHGGILWIVLAIAVGIIALVFLFMELGWINIARTKELSAAEKLALIVADQENATDVIGQSNFMVVRARENLFACRETQAITNNAHLKPLANCLVEEARRNSRLLEEERQRLVQEQLDECTALAKNSVLGGPSAARMPGIKTSEARLNTMSVGYVEGVNSNVAEPQGNPDLLGFDQQLKYIDEESHLYKGNINLKLPNEDGDLDFIVSSLPAPTKGTVAPPRLFLPELFKETARLVVDGNACNARCTFFPTAARVGLVLNVQRDGDGSPASLTAGGLATACGAALPP